MEPTPRSFPEAPETRWGRRQWPVLVLLTVLAAGLRWYALGRESVWYDEAVSILNAGLPAGEVVGGVMARDISPPLYFVLLHAWMRVWGVTDVAARALSVFLGVAAIPLVFALARRTHGGRVAMLACALTAVAVPLIGYSREARMYPLMVVLSLISMERFVRLCDPGGKDTVGLAVTNLALAYTHLFGLLVPASQLAILLAMAQRERARAFLRAHLPAALLYLPWACIVAGQAGARASGFWIGPPQPRDVYAAIHFITFAYPPLSRVGIGLVLLALGRAVFRALRGGQGKDGRTPAAACDRWTLIFGGMIALCLVTPFAFSLLVTPVFVARYFIFLSPLLLILVAAGIGEIPGRGVPAAVLTVVAVFCASAVVNFEATTRNSDWRDATAWVAHRRAPVDMMVVTGNELCLHHYDKRPVPLFNTVNDPIRGGHVSTSELRARLAGVGSLWFFETHQGADLAAYRTALARMFNIVEERSFRGIRVIRYARREIPVAPSSVASRPDARELPAHGLALALGQGPVARGDRQR